MAGSCGPMVSGGQTLKEKSLVSPLELWPSPSNASVDDKAASQLLFLTVEYVEEGAMMPSNPPLFDPAVSGSLPEFQPRVASPLDSNLDSMARYSPIPALPKPEGSDMTESIYSDNFSSPPVSGAIDVFQTTTSAGVAHEQNTQLIIMDGFYPQRSVQLSDLDPSDVDDFPNSEYILPIMPEASDKLLLDSSALNSSELLISVEDAATIFPSTKSSGRIELLLSNGNIAYGLIDSMSSPCVLQIPKEYLVNSGRLSLDDSSLEPDTELKSMLNEKSQDPKWNQSSSSLDSPRSSPFPADGRSDLLSNSLLKEPSVILHEDNLSDVFSKNISLENVEKSKLLGAPSPDTDLCVDSSSFWCEECNCFYEAECIKHKFQTICDKPVLSRARATLPAYYLTLNEVKTRRQSGKQGVFARKPIPKLTQFGPVEGNYSTIPNTRTLSSRSEAELKFSLELKPEQFVDIDVSDDEVANWMKFVRSADDVQNQNLRLCQQGKSLFFITTKTIPPKQELRVWYSPVYANKRNLPLLGVDDTDKDSSLDCDASFDHFDDIDRIDDNEVKNDERTEPENSTYLWKKKNKKLAMLGKSKLGNLSNQKSDFECDVCERKFDRYSKLKQHLVWHEKSENILDISDSESPPPHSVNKEEISERLDSDKENKSDPKTTKTASCARWHCYKCNLVFPLDSMFKMHMQTHSKAKEDFSTLISIWVCPQCSMEFENRQDLSEHVSTHAVPYNSPTPYYCSRCNKTLANADRWKRHEAAHKNEDSKPYGCSMCLRRFLSSSALICHMKYHESNKTFDCPICKASFTKVFALKAHIHLHCTDGVYKCPHCPKDYPQYTLIRKHIRSFHSDRKLACHICGKAFPTPDKLRLHALKHSDHREFLCATCGKQFKRKDKLKAHIDRIHSIEREKATSRMMDEPVKAVNGVKKFLPKLVVNTTDYNRYFYKCHSCMVGFKRRGMLVNHLANRHPEIAPDSVPELSLPILKTRRNYYCQYCDKIYKSSSKRKVHILKNHPGSALPLSNRLKSGSVDLNQLPNASYSRTVESVTSNPHSCPWCHKQYASKAKLLQHQRGKHKDLMKTLPKPDIKTLSDKTETSNCDPEKSAADILSKTSLPAAEPPHENLADLSNSCGLASSETEFSEPHETSSTITLKRDLKDGLSGVDWLNQAMAVLGPTLSDLITYVTDSNGQQTCTLNLTQEQYMKIMEQTSISPSPNCLPLMTMPLGTDSPTPTTISDTVPSEPVISQSLSPYPFATLQPVYSMPFTAR